MDFSETISGLDPAALERVAEELLQLLDGAAQSAAAQKPEGSIASGDESRRGMVFLPVETERRAERTQKQTEELSLRRDRETDAEDVEERMPEEAEQPDAAPRRRYMVSAAESAGTAARPGQTFSAAHGTAGSDMDAISEFFRRDSRRYDTGFGE